MHCLGEPVEGCFVWMRKVGESFLSALCLRVWFSFARLLFYWLSLSCMYHRLAHLLKPATLLCCAARLRNADRFWHGSIRFVEAHSKNVKRFCNYSGFQLAKKLISSIVS